jgi:hypothetical protein
MPAALLAAHGPGFQRIDCREEFSLISQPVRLLECETDNLATFDRREVAIRASMEASFKNAGMKSGSSGAGIVVDRCMRQAPFGFFDRFAVEPS